MKTIANYSFHPTILLRTPAYSYTTYNETTLDELLQDAYFIDALAHASSDMAEVIRKADYKAAALSDKAKQAIQKYHNRMCFRPTPFGMMAGLSPLKWGETIDSIVLADEKQKISLPSFRFSVQTGMHHLTAGDQSGLTYERNNSLYKVGSEWRYIKYRAEQESGKREFLIESAIDSTTLEKVFSYLEEPKSHFELETFLTNEFSVSKDESAVFLKELFHSQIIRCLHEPNITGTDYVNRILAYRNIEQQLSYSEDSDSAYINMSRAIKQNVLTNDLQSKIMDGLSVIQNLCKHDPLPLLTSFKEKFLEKFEERWVPLMEALDPETGVDYHSLAGNVHQAALLEGVVIPSSSSLVTNIPWSSTHALLMKKWQGERVPILLTEQDLATLKDEKNTHALPNSMSVLFRANENELFLENAGNASANALIGRFSILDNEINNTTKEIAALEEGANPNVIFAEIAHFSILHVANIERRSCVYQYEIPIVTGSVYDNDHRIGLSDLLVGIVKNEIILYSSKHKKRVMPRLSSALNYTKSDLSVFRFLCDLQHQNLQTAFTFNLEMFFPDLNYYPRVQYKDTILSLATWHIKCQRADISIFKNLQLPRFISINQHDNQLVFDTTVDADMNLLVPFLKVNKSIVVKEFPFINETASTVRDNKGKPYINQFIASLLHTEEIFKGIAEPLISTNKVTRKFTPGTEWLYLKIYCLPMRSNKLLTQYLSPSLEMLKLHDCIDGFFFVRYNDPNHHLRVRLHLTNSFQYGSVVKVMSEYLAAPVQNGIISKYYFDTYVRELERYGATTIYKVEKLFCASSVLVLAFLHKYPLLDNELQIYQVAFAGIQLLLEALQFSIQDRVKLFELLYFSLAEEFGGNTALKQNLSDKYRALTNNSNFASIFQFGTEELKTEVECLEDCTETLRTSVLQYSPSEKVKLTSDLIHMHLNRCFVDRQRQQEVIFYYIMNRHYMSLQAKMKKTESPPPFVL